jgi:hypothetical protein
MYVDLFDILFCRVLTVPPWKGGPLVLSSLGLIPVDKKITPTHTLTNTANTNKMTIGNPNDTLAEDFTISPLQFIS